MYNRSILNDIRDRVSISSFIGERVQLKRAGRNMKGLCPFHNEKTPSFNVSDEKGIFHCFGCGEGGDIFKFAMKFDGISFSEAVKFFAGRAGVELPRVEDPALKAAEDESARRKRLYLRVNEIARDYFISRLNESQTGAKAREYLQLRGISDEFSTQLFLGFAENSWEGMVGHLQEKKVPLELAAELGLVKQRDGGGYYDFFRNRLMFPIVSHKGEVLGFSGRSLGGGDEGAKYINSPDSALYHKSNCVYGLHIARQAIRDEDCVILVEGNIDAATLQQAGIKNAVAPLGTALTAGHLRLLKRYTRNHTIIFDGDAAGVRASMRALEVFIEEGLCPRTVALPPGEDPDSIVRKEGAAEFLKRVANAKSLFEHFVDLTIAENGADASGKVAGISKIVPMLKMVTDPAERGVYRRYAARRLDVDEQSLEMSVAAHRSFAVRTDKPAEATKVTAQKDGIVMSSAEKILVEILLSRPALAQNVFAEIDPEAFDDEWCRTAARLVKDIFARDGKLRLDDMVAEIEDAELASQILQMSLEAEKYEDDEVEELIKDCAARIKQRPLAGQLEKINEEIRSAESEKKDERLFELLAEKKELSKKIRGG